jgi:hypothetical protein
MQTCMMGSAAVTGDEFNRASKKGEIINVIKLGCCHALRIIIEMKQSIQSIKKNTIYIV